jgi:hypothetical protein
VFGDTRKTGPVGTFLILGYQKSSAAHKAYLAGRYKDLNSLPERNWVVGIPAKAHALQQARVVVGRDSPRFLVPQYEGDDPTGCRAAKTS